MSDGTYSTLEAWIVLLLLNGAVVSVLWLLGLYP